MGEGDAGVPVVGVGEVREEDGWEKRGTMGKWRSEGRGWMGEVRDDGEMEK